MDISVHNLDKKLKITLQDVNKLIRLCADKINLGMESCKIIFIDDEDLRNMHEQYLDDPDYTDVMTFNLGDENIEAEIYISLDRVKENADKFNVSVKNEIYRNIIHGLLHLKGYDDKDDQNKIIMKNKENDLLNDLNNIKNISNKQT